MAEDKDALPEPAWIGCVEDKHAWPAATVAGFTPANKRRYTTLLHTADQMRAYRAEGVSAERERCHADFKIQNKCIADQHDEIERLRELYNELLYAVSNKHPGETRHQTALRYIRQAEDSQVSGPQREADRADVSNELRAALATYKEQSNGC